MDSDISGHPAYRDLGDYFRIADNPPRTIGFADVIKGRTLSATRFCPLFGLVKPVR